MTEAPEAFDGTVPGLAGGLRDLLWQVGRCLSEPSAEGAPCRVSGRTESLLRKFCEMFALIEDRHGLATGHYLLGNIAFLRNDYAEARALYEQSAHDFAETGEIAHEARACHQLGLVAQKLGHRRDARVWYCRALSLHARTRDRASVARVYHQLGNLAYLTNDDDEAAHCYRSALELAQEMADLAGIARACYHLGLVTQRGGGTAEAHQHYQRAMGAARTLGDWATVACCQQQIAKLDASGDDGKAPALTLQQPLPRSSVA